MCNSRDRGRRENSFVDYQGIQKKLLKLLLLIKNYLNRPNVRDRSVVMRIKVNQFVQANINRFSLF